MMLGIFYVSRNKKYQKICLLMEFYLMHMKWQLSNVERVKIAIPLINCVCACAFLCVGLSYAWKQAALRLVPSFFPSKFMDRQDVIY